MGVGIAAYAFFAGRPTALFPQWLEWLEPYPQHLLNALPFVLLIYLLWRAIYADEGKGA